MSNVRHPFTQPAVNQGPDFNNCGNPVDWADQQPIDERFPHAIANALASPTVDIELARWSKDTPLAPEINKWWIAQREAIKRELATIPHAGFSAVMRARTDKGDGITKCYIRFDRKRPRAVRVAS